MIAVGDAANRGHLSLTGWAIARLRCSRAKPKGATAFLAQTYAVSTEQTSIFFGYPSRPESQREAVARAAEQITATGVAVASTWEQLRRAGNLVIDRITDAIRSADISAFEVTDINPNVLFEIGFAIGADRRLWLLRDTSSVPGTRLWEEFALLSQVGFRDYRNSDGIVAAYFTDQPQDNATLFSQLLGESLQPAAGDSIFYYPGRHDTEANRALSLRIDAERKRRVRIQSADPNESGAMPLSWYGQGLYDAAAVVLHLMPSRREGADVHNARIGLVGGIAHGLGRPLLMLAEEGYVAPFDYKGLLRLYRNSEHARDLLGEWLGARLANLDTRAQEARERRVQLRLATELRSLRLGEHVAENEEETLSEYFLETAHFNQVLANQTSIFVGRQGTGKTANMIEAARRLRQDRRNVVCEIKPVGYEWASVLRVLGSFQAKDTKGYLVEALWKLLIYSEIANEALRDLVARPAGIVGDTPEWRFATFMDGPGAFLRNDFSVRLERALVNLAAVRPSDRVESERLQISEALHAGVLRELRGLLGSLLQGKRRVAILVDNLDKAWERDAEFEKLATFLLGLLGTVGRISEEFSQRDHWREAVPVTIAVFLRTDIYAETLRLAREPYKFPTTPLVWTDREQLLQVLEERFVAARGGKVDPAELWRAFFVPSIGTVSTTTYILDRVLERPRDLVYFCNAAITAAINRRHTVVDASDISEAERIYSQFAFESAQVTDPRMQAVLFEFLQSPAIVDESSVVEKVRNAGIAASDVPSVLERLRSVSFLAQEVAPDRFDFTDDPGLRDRNDLLAQRLAEQRGSTRRFMIHRAFHRYLEITGAP